MEKIEQKFYSEFKTMHKTQISGSRNWVLFDTAAGNLQCY